MPHTQEELTARLLDHLVNTFSDREDPWIPLEEVFKGIRLEIKMQGRPHSELENGTVDTELIYAVIALCEQGWVDYNPGRGNLRLMASGF